VGMWFFLVKQVPGQGPEQRESEKTVLYLQIIIILISYIIMKLLIIENHPSRNQKRNSGGNVLKLGALLKLLEIIIVVFGCHIPKGKRPFKV
jgi:formate-dependent nitrite reductase membrane component NrfD